MKVFLLNMDGGRAVFYSEEPETSCEEETSELKRPGLRGWAERKYRSLQTSIKESEQGIGLRMKRAWDWLHRRTQADESLLRRLRVTSRIEIYHPATLTTRKAEEVWQEYLAQRSRSHMLWFIVNALITPLTLLLVPIPGPNLVGYWFVYRAICHLLAVRGTRRAQGEATAEFHPAGELDEPLAPSRDEHVEQIATRFGLKGLRDFVARVRAERDDARQATVAAR